MNIRWRRGLGSAKPGERLAILGAEKMARSFALMAECDERCAEHDIGLADCSDIRILGSSVQWGRYGGDLFLVVASVMMPSRNRRVQRWRLSPRTQEFLARQVLSKGSGN